MKKKKFSIDDVIVIKVDDQFRNDQLSEIIGGKKIADADCECDCFGGNCNTKGKSVY